MRRTAAIVVATLASAAPGGAAGQWLDLDVPRRPSADSSDLEAGRRVYDAHCWYCHGDEGDGGGPVAPYLWPRPRDFTIGSYKLRTTGSGELPLDEDLFRSVSLGLPGSAMPAWGEVLSAEERWQVVAYLKTFADGMFEDEAFDPYRAVVPVGSGPGGSRDELVEAGRRVFETSDCWECHGMEGRGDGSKAPDLADDWGYFIRATDLRSGWRFRGGRTARDVYARLSTGLDGSPMPSYVESLTDEERWQVAHYVSSLDDGRVGPEGSDAVVIASRPADDGVPAGPDDPRWDDAEELHVALTGQATFPPRWQMPSVTDLRVRALHDDAEIALRVEWNDPTPDTLAGDPAAAWREGWTADDTYPPVWPDGRRARGAFADAMEVVVPVRAEAGPVLPHFVYGDARRPVEVWRWRADRGGIRGDGSLETLRARGPSPPEPPAGPSRAVTGGGGWEAGRWSVVVRVPLDVGGRPGAVGLAPGAVVPVAFHVWDGGHGETGLRMSLSSWFFLYVGEAASPLRYALVALAVLVAVAVEYGVVRLMRRRAAGGHLAAYDLP